MIKNEVFIGYDDRERVAYNVCAFSIMRRSSQPIDITPLKLDALRKEGLYTRPHIKRKRGYLWDVISDAPMATEFANSRWLVPYLAENKWSLFMDCDMLLVTDINKVFQQVDDKYAVMCVKHDYQPKDTVKMDNCEQTQYSRKNWSSFMLINKHHPANKRLTLKMINETPGRDLHRFCWLNDDEIGGLDEGWNWLEGHSPKDSLDIYNIHYTRGGPWFDEWKDVDLANVWEAEYALYKRVRS